MLNIQIANKYARAIFELAQEQNSLDQFYHDLALVRNQLFSIPDVIDFFKNPLVPVQAKKDLINKAFNGEISSTVLNFLFLLADKSRIAFFPEIFDLFSNLKNQAQGILIADVFSAFNLSNSQLNSLADKLAEVTGKSIYIRSHSDPSLLAGIIVRIGYYRTKTVRSR